jgi:hypothetical protein
MAHRIILPAAQYVPGDLAQRSNALPTPTHQRPKNATRQRHTDEEWERLRPFITQLYYVHTLDETIKILKDRAGFETGVRCLRGKLAQWNLSNKNCSAQDMQIVLAKQEKRKRDEGKDTAVVIEGVKMELPRLINFQKRKAPVTGNHASPSAPTPDGVDYYTPMASHQRSNTHHIAAVTPTAEHSGFKAGIAENKDTKPKTVLRVTFVPSRTQQPRAPSQLHPFHQIGISGAVGSNRFGKHAKLLRCLWAGMAVIRALPSLELAGEIHPIPTFPSPLARNPPRFSIETSSPLIQWNKYAILKLLKAEGFFKHLLGLTKQDCARWQSEWEVVQENDAQDFEATVTSLFGNPLLAYPDTSRVRVMIHFRTSDEPAGDVFLQVMLCHDTREYVQGCDACASKVVAVDLSGPDGTVNAHLTAPDPTTLAIWSSLDTYESAIGVEASESFSSHRELAWSFHGWVKGPDRRKCRCGHQYGRHATHLVDVLRAEDTEHWDCDAYAHQVQSFEPFPLDESWHRLHNPDGIDSESSDNEVWDADGIKGPLEGFEAFPSQEVQHTKAAVFPVR